MSRSPSTRMASAVNVWVPLVVSFPRKVCSPGEELSPFGVRSTVAPLREASAVPQSGALWVVSISIFATLLPDFAVSEAKSLSGAVPHRIGYSPSHVRAAEPVRGSNSADDSPIL